MLCRLLAEHLQRPALLTALAETLDINQRVELLSALELLTPEHRTLIRALGKLRNALIHDASQTQFSFQEYFLDNGRRDDFVATFALKVSDPVPPRGDSES